MESHKERKYAKERSKCASIVREFENAIEIWKMHEREWRKSAVRCLEGKLKKNCLKNLSRDGQKWGKLFEV